MSIHKMTKASPNGRAKPRPINVTHGAAAVKEMAKMEKEAKRAAAKSSAKSASKPR
jgi:hypothetical protein